jgi:hypothetical protein
MSLQKSAMRGLRPSIGPLPVRFNLDYWYFSMGLATVRPGITAMDSIEPPNSDSLRFAIASNNVIALTSSTADKLSREDKKWQHGVFTKVLLDTRYDSADDIDTDHNGVISMSELTTYLAKHLLELTGGDQKLGLDMRFLDDIFVVGS